MKLITLKTEDRYQIDNCNEREKEMVDVLTSIEILCSKEKVSEYAADPDNAPKWYSNIESILWKTEKRLTKGSKITFVAHFLGKRLEYTYEIIEYAPGELLRMSTDEGPFPMETTYRWETTNEKSTLMSLRNRGNPAGFSKIFAPFMASMMKRENRKDLKKIKELLENR